jgi:hypothetical protein
VSILVISMYGNSHGRARGGEADAGEPSPIRCRQDAALQQLLVAEDLAVEADPIGGDLPLVLGEQCLGRVGAQAPMQLVLRPVLLVCAVFLWRLFRDTGS